MTVDRAEGPLAGLLVADFSRILAGPYATMLLADMGADVVRVARPEAPALAACDLVERGRRVVAIDLKSGLLSGADMPMRSCNVGSGSFATGSSQ